VGIGINGQKVKTEDVVQRHGGKNWFAIATLIPDRAKKQCLDRWNHILDANMDQADVCRG
jgi:hypothetical protein